MTGRHELHLGDCLCVMRGMAAESVDAVVTDPPFNVGMGQWDKMPNESAWADEVSRVCKANGWLAFFGQLPNSLPTLTALLERGWKLKEHVVWVKRVALPSRRLIRGHESVFIMGRPAATDFFVTTGPYEDVKYPQLWHDVVTVDAFDRWVKAKEAGKDVIVRGSRCQPKYARFNDSDSGRAVDDANFSNVWSFLSPRNADKGAPVHHPTEKPVIVMRRLIEMLCPQSGVTLDTFCGSGSTIVAAIEAGMSAIGIELDPGYHAIAERRIKHAAAQRRMF